MRLLTAVMIILVGSGLAEYFLPWWTMGIVAFAVAFLMRLSPGKAFLAGLVAVGLLWAGWALFWDIPNDHLLAGRMAKVFSLPNAALFLLVTALIGGLVGGMSAWSGAHAGKFFRAAKS